MKLLVLSLFGGESRQVWSRTKKIPRRAIHQALYLGTNPFVSRWFFSNGITSHPVNKIRTNPWFVSLFHSTHSMSEKLCWFNLLKSTYYVIHSLPHRNDFCSGPYGCWRKLPPKNVPIFKFLLLLLRFLSFLKANLTMRLTMSCRKRSKLCTVVLPPSCTSPDLPHPTPTLLPPCSWPATQKVPDIHSVGSALTASFGLAMPFFCVSAFLTPMIFQNKTLFQFAITIKIFFDLSRHTY